MRFVKVIFILLLVLALTVVGWRVYAYYKDLAMLPNSLVGQLIVVDPGHVGSDTGVIGSTGVHEKEINLIIANKLTALLRRYGATVLMTRVNNNELSAPEAGAEYSQYDQDLSRRVALANNNHADLFVSIHVNSFPDREILGPQVFYHPSSVEGRKLAAAIQKELDSDLVNPGRLIMAEDFFVLRHTKMPSALVEVGFMTNLEEERLLLEERYQNRVAWSVYIGIVRYFANKS